MPAHKAKGKSKKAFNKAVSANMHELAKNPKGRSHKQMVAIALSEARGGKKRKK